jgi:hypothetical protein
LAKFAVGIFVQYFRDCFLDSYIVRGNLQQNAGGLGTPLRAFVLGKCRQEGGHGLWPHANEALSNCLQVRMLVSEFSDELCQLVLLLAMDQGKQAEDGTEDKQPLQHIVWE